MFVLVGNGIALRCALSEHQNDTDASPWKLLDEPSQQLNFMAAHGVGIVHHPHFFGRQAHSLFGGHVQREGVEQLVKSLEHGLGVTRQEDFELRLRKFLFDSANKGCAVVVYEFVGVAGDDHTFAVLRHGRKATLHLEAIGHPEEKLRRRILAACSELTHVMQTILRV